MVWRVHHWPASFHLCHALSWKFAIDLLQGWENPSFKTNRQEYIFHMKPRVRTRPRQIYRCCDQLLTELCLFLTYYEFHLFISSESELNCKQELEVKEVKKIGSTVLKDKTDFWFNYCLKGRRTFCWLQQPGLSVSCGLLIHNESHRHVAENRDKTDSSI